MNVRRLCVVALGIPLAGFAVEHEQQWNLSVRLAGGLVAYACRDSEDPSCGTKDVERRFEHWLDSGPRIFEPPPCSSTETSLDGLWGRFSIFEEGSHLKVALAQGGGGEITYWSSGHVAEYSFSRLAKYENSELRLDGPVTPYVGDAYFQFFSVRLGDTLYLVPGPAVRYVAKAAEGNTCEAIDPHKFGGAILRRLSESEARDARLPG